MADADAVVIGAGPNGLVAANILVDAGWDVLVVEAAATPGGAVRSEELLEPGFVNDRCSAFYPFAPVSPLAALGLEDHGLRWLQPPAVLAHPASDGTCPTIWPDVEATAASLDDLEPGDGQAWLALHAEWRRYREPLLAALLGPFPPVRAGTRLALTLRRDLLRTARSFVLTVRRMGEERFAGDGARRLLAGIALHADHGPDSATGAMYGLLLGMLGQDHGFPVPQGGAGSITTALVRRLRQRGGELRCGQPVTRVAIDGGGRATGVVVGDELLRARRAIVADVDAPQLFWRLVGQERLPPSFVADLRHFQWDLATVKVDWNLDRPVPWSAPPARQAGTVHVVDDVDALTRQHAELACRLLPTRPFVLVGQQSMTDPTRQPAGAETLWAYTHVPQDAVGDGAGVIDAGLRGGALEAFADRVQAEVERLAPGFGSSIRGRFVVGPSELQAHDANLHQGALGGGTAQLHQMLVFRPVPGLARAETPIRRLFLGSASAHPGGAVHGAPGANAARAALWHARLGQVVGRR